MSNKEILNSQVRFRLPAFSRGFHLITSLIEEQIRHWDATGVLHVFILHTSAGLALNENADPSVRKDMNAIFDELVPENQPFYTHTFEGPDDMPAHAKSILCGSSLSIPITKGRLQLGVWQGVYLGEFRDGARGREIVVTLLT